jgi:hypothetical protein
MRYQYCWYYKTNLNRIYHGEIFTTPPTIDQELRDERINIDCMIWYEEVE